MDKIIENYLSNIQVKIIIAEYTKCHLGWSEYDYIPDYNKFYYIKDGEGMVKVDDHTYYPAKEELYLMPAGHLQSYAAVNENTFLKYWCHFNATVNDMNLFDLIKLPDYIRVSDSPYLTGLFQKLISHYNETSIASKLLVKAALLEIIAYYLEVAETIEFFDSHTTKKLQPVLRYIDLHLHEPINIMVLANLAHFHPTHFIRFFKAATGISPIKYIYKMRIEKAKTLLKETTLSVTEISEKTGFQNVFHFSKAFKKLIGYSPSEFRKMIQP